MSSLTGTVAAAVVSALQDAGYTDAVLSYAPAQALAGGAAYSLTVSPSGYEPAQQYNRISRTVKVMIVLLAKISSPADFETHNETVENIAELFFLKQLAGVSKVSCNTFTINPMGSEQRFRETGQYLAAAELEFLSI